MHLADLESGILGTNAIVGGGIALASGAVWAHTIRKKRRAAASPIWETEPPTRAYSTSPSTWPPSGRSPIVYFIENNLYAVATHISESCAIPRLAQHGLAHGAPPATR